MSYHFLEHTADVLVECRAPDFAGLLTTAAEALYETALRIVLPKSDTRRVISVTADTHEEALVRWLQELIFLLDVDRFVATHVEFDWESELSFGATLSGYVCEPEERADEVKGATYHGMTVEQTTEGLRTRIMFDL
jgi:SHS2 domain-containing protein